MSYCTSCGSKLSGAMKFCGECGHAVSEESAATEKRTHQESFDLAKLIESGNQKDWERFIAKLSDVAVPKENQANCAVKKFGITEQLDSDEEIAESPAGTLWVTKYDYDGPDLDFSRVVSGYVAQPQSSIFLVPVDDASFDDEVETIWRSEKNWSNEFGAYDQMWVCEYEIDCPRCSHIFATRNPADAVYNNINAELGCPACDSEGYVTLIFA